MKENNKVYNHLIHEKSPYLLQHAYNYVEWYPWGELAIKKAKKEDKPIIISIGYSTCHWCHVMEKESFSNKEISKIMNENFINIKIDREERPDLDKIYITAVSAITGSAGWPLNVFLSPYDLKPFFGGTYFPPETKQNYISWPNLITEIGLAWKNNAHRKKLLHSANVLTDLIKKEISDTNIYLSNDSLNSKSLDLAYEQFESSFDNEYGGFGNAPKFPSPSNLNFLFFIYYFSKYKNHKIENGKKAINMAVDTLDKMAKGGIYDQLGGGFHRYSTDSRWHVPHFEKMLYDNAQLIINYLDSYTITKNTFFSDIAKDSIDYVLRDMTHANGGFFSALDADSVSIYDKKIPKSENKVEGAYYVWQKDEIIEILGKEHGEIFSFIYGVKNKSNVLNDLFNEFNNKNVLYLNHSLNETSKKFNANESEIKNILHKAKQKLFNKRENRPKPFCDDKIITAWNGLMISALAKAYITLGNEKYLIAAKKAATFIYTNLYNNETKELFRIFRNGKIGTQSFSSDYSFLIKALIDLYEADFDTKWLELAITLSKEQIKYFFDKKQSIFFMTRKKQDKHLLFKVKEEHDSVLPSSGSITALNLIRLSRMTGDIDYFEIAKKSIKTTVFSFKQSPSYIPQMLVSMGSALLNGFEIIIVGDRESDNTKQLLKVAQLCPEFMRSIILIDSKDRLEKLKKINKYIENINIADNSSKAYVCKGNTCKAPVTNSIELEKLLKKL